jgi:hypothetical protein
MDSLTFSDTSRNACRMQGWSLGPTTPQIFQVSWPIDPFSAGNIVELLVHGERNFELCSKSGLSRVSWRKCTQHFLINKIVVIRVFILRHYEN